MIPRRLLRPRRTAVVFGVPSSLRSGTSPPTARCRTSTVATALVAWSTRATDRWAILRATLTPLMDRMVKFTSNVSDDHLPALSHAPVGTFAGVPRRGSVNMQADLFLSIAENQSNNYAQ